MEFDLDACVRGDRRAWSAFVAHALPIIRAAVRRTLRDDLIGASDREDVVQEVFIRLLKDDGRLLRTYQRERAAMSTWLTLVARSVAIDQARASTRRRVGGIPDHLTPADHRSDGDAAPPSPPLGTSIALDVLTDRQRLILSLLFERDLSVADVAIILGVDQQTVRSTKHKAMLRLRDQLSATEPPSRSDSGGPRDAGDAGDARTNRSV